MREGARLGRGRGVEVAVGEERVGERVRLRMVAVEEVRSEVEIDMVRPEGSDFVLSRLREGLRDGLGELSLSVVVALEEELAVLLLSRLLGSPPWVSARRALAMFSASMAYSTS